METLPEYTYESLPDSNQWFRVLELRPGDGPLSCTLSMRRFDDAKGTYEAVSYVWGDPIETVGIICGAKQVQVTPNLYALLSQFRDATETRVLWADAICINQKDDEEKSYQVRRMGTIYENARDVLIWLGDDTGAAHDCFETIGSINQELEEVINPKIQARTIGMQDFRRMGPIFHKISEPQWTAIESITTRPYFTRLWILQEVGLAASAVIHSGSESMRISELVQFAVLCNIAMDQCPSHIHGVCSRYVLFWSAFKTEDHWNKEKVFLSDFKHSNPKEAFDCISILHGGRSQDARDGRDRIYAFYGHPLLAPLAENVPVSYQISKEDLYFQVASFFLRIEAYNWKMLAYCGCNLRGDPQDTDSSSPSWVPTWGVRGNMSSPQWLPWYAAGGKGIKFETAVQPNRHLVIRGLVVDTVRSISKKIDHSENRCDDTATVGAILSQLDLTPDDLSEDQVKSLSLALVRGADMEYRPAEENITEHRERVIGYNQFFSSPSEAKENILGYQYLETMDRALFGNVVFYTESGDFGVGLCEIQPGDVCCLFLGADMPFILRPTKKPNQYILVGCCYLQGYMRGEVMTLLHRKNIGLEDLIIV